MIAFQARRVGPQWSDLLCRPERRRALAGDQADRISVPANLFKSSDRRQLHSIVGAGAIASQDVAAGWVTGLEIFALISLSLGIVNLVPLLPLDGGHIFWAVAEKLRGRRIPYKVMERCTSLRQAVRRDLSRFCS